MRTTPHAGASQPTTAAAAWVQTSLCILLIVLAFLFGGSRQGDAWTRSVIYLPAAVLLATWAWVRSPKPFGTSDWLAAAILAGLLLTALMQLTPLFGQVWALAPGRAQLDEMLAQSGLGPRHGPLSLDPDATVGALLWCVPAISLFLVVQQVDLRTRAILVAVALLMCIASLVLGGLQMLQGPGSPFEIYSTGHAGLPHGLFANRNHQGVALACALPLTAALAVVWRRLVNQSLGFVTLVFLAVATLLLVGILATQSRAALALGVLGLGQSLLLFSGVFERGLQRSHVVALCGLLLLLSIAAYFGSGPVLNRFGALQEGDARYQIWDVTLKAAEAYFPVGSGLGTFRGIYTLYEPSSMVAPYFINNAHNDYLELLLEMGLPFLVLLALFFAWLIVRITALLRQQKSVDVTFGGAGLVVISLLMLHSIVDYPLRTQALSCLFGLALGLAAARSPERDSRGRLSGA